MKSNTTIAIFVAILALLMSGTILAKPGDNKHRKTPEAALNACADLTENAACSFTNRKDKQVSGVCLVTRNDDLACASEARQARMEKRQQKQAASLAACAGLALEDSCAVTNPAGEERLGSCNMNRNEELVCRISRPDRPKGNRNGSES